MQGNHHIGCSLLALQGLPPVFVRLRNADVSASLSPHLDVPVKLRRVVGVSPLLFEDIEGVLLYLSRSDPANCERFVVLVNYKIDFLVF